MTLYMECFFILLGVWDSVGGSRWCHAVSPIGDMTCRYLEQKVLNLVGFSNPSIISIIYIDNNYFFTLHINKNIYKINI